jgi:hypothetical protein
VLLFGRVRGLSTVRLRGNSYQQRQFSMRRAPCRQAPAFSLQIAR